MEKHIWRRHLIEIGLLWTFKLLFRGYPFNGVTLDKINIITLLRLDRSLNTNEQEFSQRVIVLHIFYIEFVSQQLKVTSYIDNRDGFICNKDT